MKNKVKVGVLTWIFLVLAVIMVILAIYYTQDAVKYVNNYAAQYGASVSDTMGDAVKYVMNAAIPYLIYAICMAGIAAIMHKIDALKACLTAEVGEAEAAAVEEVLVAAEEAVEEEAEQLAEEALRQTAASN